jgi:hypothetical protein
MVTPWPTSVPPGNGCLEKWAQVILHTEQDWRLHKAVWMSASKAVCLAFCPEDGILSWMGSGPTTAKVNSPKPCWPSGRSLLPVWLENEAREAIMLFRGTGNQCRSVNTKWGGAWKQSTWKRWLIFLTPRLSHDWKWPPHWQFCPHFQPDGHKSEYWVGKRAEHDGREWRASLNNPDLKSFAFYNCILSYPERNPNQTSTN